MQDRNRLKRPGDFRRVYTTRRDPARGAGSSSGRVLAVRWCPNDLGHPRLGFSVSTKVGGAVTRNLVKRRLREVASPLLDGLTTGVDVVVVARPEARATAFAELSAEFRTLLAPVLGL